MKTTKEHFHIFKEEAIYWLNYFGLKDWSVYFSHKKISADARAEVTWKIIGRVCGISLALEWDMDDADEMQFRKSAFYEVCELLIAPLSSLAGYFISQETITEQIHMIVRRLENTIFKERMERMPLTSKGKTIKAAMRKEYGEKKGDRVFYASQSKGTIKGTHKKK